MIQSIVSIEGDDMLNCLSYPPVWIMFLLEFAYWVYWYNENLVSFLIFLGLLFFSLLCIFSAIYQLLKKNIKKCICILLPVVVLVSIQTNTIGRAFAHSRHYVEFLIQKNQYIPEIAELEDKIDNRTVLYKEWCIAESSTGLSVTSSSSTKYWIVFDAKDEIQKKDGTSFSYTEGRNDIIEFQIYKVGKHFYVLSKSYRQW